MSGLMPYVDVCIANEADAADVFGIHAEDTDVENGELNRAGYIGVAKEICRRFGCKKAALRQEVRPENCGLCRKILRPAGL